MECTLDFHINTRNKLCRACGEQSMKSRKANQRRHLCVNFKSDLLIYYCIDIDTDFNHQHSTTVNAPTGYTTSVAIQVSSDSSYPWTAYNDNMILEDIKDSLISSKQ